MAPSAFEQSLIDNGVGEMFQYLVARNFASPALFARCVRTGGISVSRLPPKPQSVPETKLQKKEPPISPAALGGTSVCTKQN